MTKRSTLILSLILITFGLSACIQTEAPERSRRFSLLFNATDLGDQVIRGGDRIRVDQVVIHVPSFEAGTATGDSIVSNRPIFLNDTEGNLGLDVIVFTEDLGFVGINGFDNFKMSVDTVSILSQIQDANLVSESRFYTLYADLSYNGQRFRFRSQLKRDFNFDFAPVNYSEENETIFIRLLMDTQSWFVDANADTVINPQLSANRGLINNNIANSVSLEVEAGTIFED
jgi:hypothetical protein